MWSRVAVGLVAVLLVACGDGRSTPSAAGEVAPRAIDERTAAREDPPEVTTPDIEQAPVEGGLLSVADAVGLRPEELAAAWGAPTRETPRRVWYSSARRVEYDNEGRFDQIVALPTRRAETEIPAYEWLGVSEEAVAGCRRTSCGLCLFSSGGVSVARESRHRYFFGGELIGLHR